MYRREEENSVETRYLTATIKPKHRPRRKRPSSWTIYARLSVLALAAMMTARLVLLMIDVIQAEVDAPGAVAIPLYAVWLIFTGWKLKEWTAGTTKEEPKRCNTESAPAAGLTLTLERSATAAEKEAMI